MEPFIDSKAGMDGVDKARVQRIIDENTGINFDSHAKRRQKRIAERIKLYEEKIATFSPHQVKDSEKEMDKIVNVLEKERDLSHYAVHIDMDAFFAAVEMRDNPSLRHVPMAVGSDSMLSTSNYSARRYGVRSAMPGFIAKKLCPDLKIVHSNFDKYRKASVEIRNILKEYDEKYLMGSLDEAYMDITIYLKKREESGPAKFERHRYTGGCICRLPLMNLVEINENSDVVCTKAICEQCGETRIDVSDMVEFGVDVDDVVREIRFRVEQDTGLTCSAGIAPNSMLAKVCSNINKPNGQYRVPNEAEAVLTFIRSLPIRKINGIGPVTEAVLKGIGVEKCGELYERRGIIGLLFTQFNYEYFMRIASGISHTYSADNNWRRKSISVERTFKATGDMKALLEIIDNLCNELVDSLPDHKIVGGYSATLKMKYSTFDVITRCTSVASVISDADRLYPICEKFLRQELRDDGKQLRLLGVRLSRLVFQGDKVEKDVPLTMFWKNQLSESTTNVNEVRNKNAEGSNEFVFVSEAENSKLSPKSASTHAEVSSTKVKEFGSGCAGDQEACLAKCECSGNSEKPTLDTELSSVAEKNAIVSDEASQRCPMCGTHLPENLAIINHHIDECLNRDIIRELQHLAVITIGGISEGSSAVASTSNTPKSRRAVATTSSAPKSNRAVASSSPPKSSRVVASTSSTPKSSTTGRDKKGPKKKKAEIPAITIDRFLIKKPREI